MPQAPRNSWIQCPPNCDRDASPNPVVPPPCVPNAELGTEMLSASAEWRRALRWRTDPPPQQASVCCFSFLGSAFLYAPAFSQALWLVKPTRHKPLHCVRTEQKPNSNDIIVAHPANHEGVLALTLALESFSNSSLFRPCPKRETLLGGVPRF